MLLAEDQEELQDRVAQLEHEAKIEWLLAKQRKGKDGKHGKGLRVRLDGQELPGRGDS